MERARCEVCGRDLTFPSDVITGAVFEVCTRCGYRRPIRHPARPPLDTPEVRRVVSAVRTCPGASVTDVARRCGLAPSTVAKRIQDALALGLLVNDTPGQGRRARLRVPHA